MQYQWENARKTVENEIRMMFKKLWTNKTKKAKPKPTRNDIRKWWKEMNTEDKH